MFLSEKTNNKYYTADQATSFRQVFAQYAFAVIIVICVSLACFPLTELVGYKTISLFLLLTILLLPLYLRRGPVIAAAAVGALSWNYFFIPPLFTFAIKHPEDILMLAMFFIVAVITGTLSAQVRQRESTVRQREIHSSALYSLTKDLSSAHSQDEVIKAAVFHIQKFFDAEVAVFLGETDGDIVSKPHSASTWIPCEDETKVGVLAYWNERNVADHRNIASTSQGLFLVMPGPRYPLGVIGIKLSGNKKLTPDSEVLLENFVSQISSAVERELLNELTKKSIIVAESERLYKTLFNSISHELRTPIAAILGASENLLMMSQEKSASLKELYSEIHIGAERLNRLVANLLDMSRLESGMIKPKLDWCDVQDIFNQSIQGLEQENEDHFIKVDVPEEFPLVKMDFGLIEQAITNLIYNAIVHTPAGTSIIVKARIENTRTIITVADDGPGIPKDEIKKIFDKFYRVEGSVTGGTGLGLPIAKGFIEAHHGILSVKKLIPHGTEFIIEIPLDLEPKSL